MKSKYSQYLAVLSTLVLLLPVAALARDKAHSVEIPYVTVPGTLKTNDDQVTQDAIVTEATIADTTSLKEIDFGHQKEALVFDQGQNQGGQ